MRVLIVKGYLITAADTDEESIPQILGCAKGCIRITELRDGAVMFTDREAVQRKESPYNAYASLVSCSRVYGPAVIAGRNRKDIPDSYIPLLEWNDLNE